MAGTVLASNGSGLSYQFIADVINAKPFSLGIPDAGVIPQTDGYGLLDPSFYYKNPIYINIFSSIVSTLSSSKQFVGLFPFRFDKYILEGLQSITLETILNTASPTDPAVLSLANLTTLSGINLTPSVAYLTTSDTNPTYIVSQDIKSQLATGPTDYIYVVTLNNTNGISSVTCSMVRLVLTYTNPSAGTLLTHSYNFGAFPTFPNLPS
jgi:hypothetical protein